jgi:hypothetical protein
MVPYFLLFILYSSKPVAEADMAQNSFFIVTAVKTSNLT